MNTTVAIILCAVLGFVVSALLGIVLVPWLHKLKFGQTILDIGPSWHKKKSRARLLWAALCSSSPQLQRFWP